MELESSWGQSLPQLEVLSLAGVLFIDCTFSGFAKLRKLVLLGMEYIGVTVQDIPTLEEFHTYAWAEIQVYELPKLKSIHIGYAAALSHRLVCSVKYPIVYVPALSTTTEYAMKWSLQNQPYF
jgi:hypothetical protein